MALTILQKSKKVSLDIVWQTIGAVLFRGSIFLANIFLANKISTELFGQVGYLINYATAASAIISTMLGVPVRRELAKGRYNKQITAIFILSAVASFLISLIFSLIITFVPKVSDIISDVGGLGSSVMMILVFSYSMINFSNYFYSGLLDFRKYNLVSLPFAFILILLIIFIDFKDALLPLMFFAITSFFNVIALYIYCYQNYRGYKVTDRQEVNDLAKSIYKTGLPAGLSAVMGLPVFLLLQTWIILNTKNYEIIAVIVIATQFLNVSNILINKVLGVIMTNIARNVTRTFFAFKKVVLLSFGGFTILSASLLVSLAMVLPVLLPSIKPDYLKFIFAIQFFCIAYIASAIFWFIAELFHVLDRSWNSFMMNLLWAVLTIGIFWVYYFFFHKVTVWQYMVSITLSRVLPVAIFIIVVLKKLKFYHNEKSS